MVPQYADLRSLISIESETLLCWASVARSGIAVCEYEVYDIARRAASRDGIESSKGQCWQGSCSKEKELSVTWAMYCVTH